MDSRKKRFEPSIDWLSWTIPLNQEETVDKIRIPHVSLEWKQMGENSFYTMDRDWGIYIAHRQGRLEVQFQGFFWTLPRAEDLYQQIIGHLTTTLSHVGHCTRLDIAQDFVGYKIDEILPKPGKNVWYSFVTPGVKREDYHQRVGEENIYTGYMYRGSKFSLKCYRKDIENENQVNKEKKAFYQKKFGENLCSRLELNIRDARELLIATQQILDGQVDCRKVLASWAKNRSIRKRKTGSIDIPKNWPKHPAFEDVFFTNDKADRAEFHIMKQTEVVFEEDPTSLDERIKKLAEALVQHGVSKAKILGKLAEAMAEAEEKREKKKARVINMNAWLQQAAGKEDESKLRTFGGDRGRKDVGNQ